MDQNKKAGGVLQAWLRLCVLALTLWVGSSVAQSPAGVYYVHTDHLNTPRAITNQVGQTVWSWDNTDPFGANAPNENPSGLGTFTCNLRLPGQYFDKETNLYYNYFRDYDPSIGRYIQSDPIGLEGGLNTYGYVGSNPLNFMDPEGLKNYPAPRPQYTPPVTRGQQQYASPYGRPAENRLPQGWQPTFRVERDRHLEGELWEWAKAGSDLIKGYQKTKWSEQFPSTQLSPFSGCTMICDGTPGTCGPSNPSGETCRVWCGPQVGPR
jgi:RHS repeat-associated protein